MAKTDYYYHTEFNENNSGILYAYPPAVGAIWNVENCMSYHPNNGHWEDEENTIIDIIDIKTKKSFRQPNGNFLNKVRYI